MTSELKLPVTDAVGVRDDDGDSDTVDENVLLCDDVSRQFRYLLTVHVVVCTAVSNGVPKEPAAMA